MSNLSPLPRRWLRNPQAARHAETIRDILDTPPITPSTNGLVLFAEIGTAKLLPFLVAIKSLHARLGRGRVALLDDGTLIGADRALLAHHCGDPEIIPPASNSDTALPDGSAWHALRTVLERRRTEYWLSLSSDSVTIGPVPEIEQAIALNASFLLLGEGPLEGPKPLRDFCRAAYPDGPIDGNVTAQLESRLGEIARPDRRYVRGDAGLMGFAAGGPGLHFAAASRSDLEHLVDAKRMSEPGAAQVAANLQLSSENRTQFLPRERYRHDGAAGWDQSTSFLRFAGEDRHADGRYAEASRIAIEALRRK